MMINLKIKPFILSYIMYFLTPYCLDNLLLGQNINMKPVAISVTKYLVNR